MSRGAARTTAALLGALLALTACGSTTPSGSAAVASVASVPPSASAVASAGVGEVVPAPGSDSTVYEPSPSAIVVAIDPGHGGCLDWGVPDPLARGAAFAEKTMTLAIGLELRRLLEAQGITVVMTRTTDDALAGDDYPGLGCNGPPWRDVNGDGESGFDPEGKTRTHDELQARLDLVNLARADLLVSIHINAVTEDGVAVEIAATETYWTDETLWGPTATQHLAQLVQAGVLAALDPVAPYDRQDRGISAVNFFIVAPPLFETTPDRPDPRKQPTRGALLPAILTEVGYITLPAEQDLLLSPTGQAAAAQGISDALAAYFTHRPLAVRFDAILPDGAAGIAPEPVAGTGPPYWPLSVGAGELAAGLPVRVVNTGTSPWPEGLTVLFGWEASEQPYLRRAPADLTELGVSIPPLAPGESVELVLPLTVPGSDRAVVWITLADGEVPLTDLGSAPLQLATGGG